MEPDGPRIRCRRFTKRSLLRTWLRILMMSQAIPSSRILRAWQWFCCQCWLVLGKCELNQLTCCTGTLLASNLIKSLAFKIAAGSNVFRVVFTVILPSTKSRVHAIPCFSSALVTTGHASFRYTSRYLGNRVTKEDSSAKLPATLSSALNSSICFSTVLGEAH